MRMQELLVWITNVPLRFFPKVKIHLAPKSRTWFGFQDLKDVSQLYFAFHQKWANETRTQYGHNRKHLSQWLRHGTAQRTKIKNPPNPIFDKWLEDHLFAVLKARAALRAKPISFESMGPDFSITKKLWLAFLASNESYHEATRFWESASSL